MKYAEYESIRVLVEQQKLTPQQIAQKHPDVLYDSIVSIWSGYWQKVEYDALKLFRRKSSRAKEDVCRKFAAAATAAATVDSTSSSPLLLLLTLARQYNLSPCALIRELLTECQLTKQQIKECIRQPDCVRKAMQTTSTISTTSTAAATESTLSPSPSSVTSASPLSSLLTSIPIDRWISEIRDCVENDTHNSPFVDALKGNTGSHYESLLESYLSAHNIPYQTESTLRSDGKQTKTPDILLSTPVLHVPSGHIINWIDSKAHFGCPTLKKEHLEGQLRSYVNRYGTGAVIYWIDFVEGENGSCTTPIGTNHLKKNGSESSSTAISPSASSSSSSPHHIDLASPALDEDGRILLLTQFPSELMTMKQLLDKEMGGMMTDLLAMGKRENAASTATAPSQVHHPNPSDLSATLLTRTTSAR